MNDSVTMKSLLVLDTPNDCPLLRIYTISNVEEINSAINNIEDVLSGGDEIYPSTLNNALNALTILKRILSV